MEQLRVNSRQQPRFPLRDLRREDAVIYICVATSAGVFDIETISDVRLDEPRASGTGKL